MKKFYHNFIFIAGSFFFLLVTGGDLFFGLPVGSAAVSSPVWMEKKLRQPMPKSSKKEKEEKKKEQKEKKTDQKRRQPMSRPAEYLIKSGTFPDGITDFPSLLSSICWLKKPDQGYTKIVPQKTDAGILLFDDAFQRGLYQLFLYHDAGVEKNVRYHHFSMLWFRNAGETDFETQDFKGDKEGFYEEQPIFYLKELTEDDENDFVALRRYTGDMLPIQVLFKGKPVADALVTLTTSRGWKKTVLTDQDGKASFLLIKEVFHADKVDKNSKPYLVTARYSVDKSGSVRGVSYSKETYTASSHLNIYPTPLDWKSKSLGFCIFSASVLAVAFAAAIRRKRSQAI